MIFDNSFFKISSLHPLNTKPVFPIIFFASPTSVATDVGDAKKIIGNTGFVLSGCNEEILKKELSKIIKIKKKCLISGDIYV